MATRIAWWLNLDSAMELEAPSLYRPSPRVQARLPELCARMETLLRADDVLLDPHTHAAPEHVTALAFCPTPSALQALRARGLRPPLAPELDVLRRVTSRAFAAELGQSLPGAAYVRSLSQLEGLVQEPSISGEWLLKRDFGFAGRERLRVRSGALAGPSRGFARRSFERGQGLTVEPYVARVADFAQHGYLPGQGRLLVGPVMLQHCDERGAWLRSEPAADDALDAPEQAALAASVREAGRALERAGYVGPFGVDAFRYRMAMGELRFQPRCEVNARFSMGYPRALLEQALPYLDASAAP